MQILWCLVGLTGPQAKGIDSVEGKGKELGGGTGGGGGTIKTEEKVSIGTKTSCWLFGQIPNVGPDSSLGA